MAGGGEMGALMRSHDWAASPLGPVAQWPQSLRTTVSTCLDCAFPILVWWGPDLVMLYNDEYRPILGSEKHPAALGAAGRSVWPEIWHVIGPMLEQVMTRGEATRSRDLLLIMDRYGYKEETYFSFSYSPIRDETGGVGGVFTPVIETTGRVIGERRLRTLRDLAVRTRTDGVAEACRGAAEVLADNPYDIPFALIYHVEDGVGQARLVGTAGIAPGAPGAPEALDLAEPQAGAWPLADVIRTGRVAEVEVGTGSAQLPSGAWPDPPRRALVLPVTAAGRERPNAILVAAVSPRRALDDEHRSFFDLVAAQLSKRLTEATAYEEERRRAAALAEIDRAKTAFFSNVSHEFRTPLTLMMSPLEEVLAKAEDQLSMDNRQLLEVAHRNSLRLLKLVNTLLDFSRIEAGRTQASYEPVDLAALTAELASNFRSAIEKAGLALRVECPPLREPVYVDRDMWEKIVLNLLSNAFKFTFAGEIEVALRPSEDGRHVRLAIRDTGTGIPAHELPRLFERFHRVEGAKGRSYEGSGIGLALVQELIKLHGGTIDVESEVGHGSTFVVMLPRGSSHLRRELVGSAPALAPTAMRAEAFVEEALRWLPEEAARPGSVEVVRDELDPYDHEPTPGGRPFVLLADDNADMRDYVRRLLGSRYEVETAPDGERALAAARARPPDLVLCDVMMPRLDGFGLIQAMRTDPQLKHVPIMLLSARSGEEARVEGLQAGADDYLAKPFSARELLARVAARLELARLRAHLDRERTAFANLFMQSPLPVAVLRGPDLVYEMANPAYLTVAGRRDIVGKPLLQALPELAGQGFDVLLRRVLQTGEPQIGHEAHIRLERHLGGPEDTYWTFIYAPLRDPAGRVEGVIAISNEVTEEVRARRSIIESEARYRNIFQTAGVSIWEQDFSRVKAMLDALVTSGCSDLRDHFARHPEFVAAAVATVKIVDVNDATLRMFGATSKDELTQSLDRVLLPESLAVFADQLLAIAERRPSFEAEMPLRTLRGEPREVWLTIAFPPEDADLRNVLVTLTDMTERKRAERSVLRRMDEQAALYRFTDRLRRAETQDDIHAAALEAIVEALGCARASILLFDDDGVMRFVAWRGLSDRYRDAVEGHSPWKPGDRDATPVCIDDIEAAAEPEALKRVVREEGIRALAFIPLIANGFVVGKFMAYHEAPHVFDGHEMNLAVTIARQLVFSLQRERAEKARRVAEDQRTLLINELNHRVKNTLATVQSLAVQTLRNTERSVDARELFESRLVALSRAHDVLTRQSWEGANLRDMMERALEPFRLADGRISIGGEDVRLSPRQALALSMALHELATNAAKYGALSNESGRVGVDWIVFSGEGKNELQITWKESNGPHVEPPRRRGFGSRMIERNLSNELGGAVSLDYRPEGVVCVIRSPIGWGTAIPMDADKRRLGA